MNSHVSLFILLEHIELGFVPFKECFVSWD
jgi:hypothetical protein